MLSVTTERGGTDLVIRRVDGSTNVREALADLGVELPVRRRGGQHVVDVEHGAALLRGGTAVKWDEDTQQAVLARHEIRKSAPQVLQDLRHLRDGPLNDARVAIGDSSMAEMLDDHQVRNVAVMTHPDGWGTCVFDEQGTGKTVTLISAFDLLVERNLADVLLVVAPKSMIAEWAVEFSRFTEGMYQVSVVDGDRRTKVAAVRAGADVVVMSYESVASLTDEVVRLARRCRLVLAVDESFNAKNRDAVRTAALMRVRQYCSRAFALCGTPAPNAGADLISQFDLVDLGLTFGGIALPKDRLEANEAVRTRLEASGFYLRSLKQDVLRELPDRELITVEVNLAGDQARAYEAALRDLVLDLRGASDQEFARSITSYLARRAALLRICSDPTPVIPGYSEIPAKIAALDGLLERVLGRGDKAVIWSFYRTTLDLVSHRYAHHGLVRVDGSVPSTDRRAAVSRFQTDAGVRLFVGNPAAAGAGLTLTAGRVAIYESMSNQAAHYMQSLDRIHRRGQTLDVEYYFLVCNGTIEEAEHQRLLDKAGAQGDLLGDVLNPPMTRSAMLDELLRGR